MIQDWMFYVAAGLLVVTMILLWTSRKRISNLEEVVNYLVNSRNEMRKDIDEDHKKVIRFGKQIEEHQGTMQVCSSTLSDKISKIEKKVDIQNKTIQELINPVPDEDDIAETPEEIEENRLMYDPMTGIEFWAGMEKLADIVDPSNLADQKIEDENKKFLDDLSNTQPYRLTSEDKKIEWQHDDEIIGYRWIFPTKEEHTPVVGQKYLVVGRLRGHETMADGSPFICTETASWNSHQFVTDDGDRYDKVYAYIKMPDSSDIMTSILEITLHDRGD